MRSMRWTLPAAARCEQPPSAANVTRPRAAPAPRASPVQRGCGSSGRSGRSGRSGSALLPGDPCLQAAHSGEPAVVVGGLAPPELEDLLVRDDQEALLAQRGDDGVGDLLGLEHAPRRLDDGA